MHKISLGLVYLDTETNVSVNISVVHGNNRREYFESGPSENQGLVATHPVSQSACTALSPFSS